jgi:hypothetical protein
LVAAEGPVVVVEVAMDCKVAVFQDYLPIPFDRAMPA